MPFPRITRMREIFGNAIRAVANYIPAHMAKNPKIAVGVVAATGLLGLTVYKIRAAREQARQEALEKTWSYSVKNFPKTAIAAIVKFANWVVESVKNLFKPAPKNRMDQLQDAARIAHSAVAKRAYQARQVLINNPRAAAVASGALLTGYAIARTRAISPEVMNAATIIGLDLADITSHETARDSFKGLLKR